MPPGPTPIRRAFLAGALAGLTVGVADTLAAWAELAPFLPGVGGRLRAALFAGGLYGLATAIAATAIALVALAMWRGTALGPLFVHAIGTHRAARARDPRGAMAGLAIMLALVPLVAAALGFAHRFGLFTVVRRNHKGLAVAVVIAVTLGALAAAVLAAFAVGRIVEQGLRALPARVIRPLSHEAAPFVAVAVLALVGLGAAAWVSRDTLRLLALRPGIIALALAPACVAWWPIAGRLRDRLRVLPALVTGALLLVVFVAGASAAARKGTAAATGLAGPLTQVVRGAFDLDRDGHSTVLGGGDCDDWDRDIHPAADDFPGDGVDQNCSGADAGAATTHDTAFAALPAGVPADANIVFITLDTVRADHIGAYGARNPTSPAIDGLAAEGTLFVNGWAHAPSTRYSMPAILTGRYPSQIYWDNSIWWPGIRKENVSLPELLARRGFHTGGIFNYDYFDRFRDRFAAFDNENRRLHGGRDPASTRGSSSREQADKAIAFLEANAGRRFFLWVHFYDPHFEYERHPEVPSFGDDPKSLYDHEIRFTDLHIGRVLDQLRALGLWDKTVVVVTGDHGEGFGERKVDFHGYHLYAPQTKVPFIIRVPGLRPRRVATPVGHVDLLPTLVNLAGGAGEAWMAGRSLVPELAGAPDRDRDVFQELSYEGPTERRALVTRRWHLIHNQVPDNSFELYDIANDPGLTRDLWGNAEGEALRQRLVAWTESVRFPPETAQKLARAAWTTEQPGHPLEARLGDQLVIHGYDVASRGALHAGDQVPIAWYLECLRPLEPGWRLFVHVEGPQRFLGDHDPVEGLLPLSRLRPGQRIIDRSWLVVPAQAPPGEYTIWIGAFKGAKRLRVAGTTDDRVRAGTIRVIR